jgi:hypothetical protein
MYQIEMKYCPDVRMALNPYIANIFIDSCVFDPKEEPENSCSEEIFSKYEKGEINLVVSHSNMKEAEHPNTPARIKSEAASKIFTLNTSLTPAEQNKKNEIWSILTGNGKPAKMKPDSEHVFEAHKYGGYFVTTDNRIIKKRTELGKICNAIIVKPCELVVLLSEYKKS